MIHDSFTIEIDGGDDADSCYTFAPIDRVEQLYYLDKSTLSDVPRLRLDLHAGRGRSMEGVRR